MLKEKLKKLLPGIRAQLTVLTGFLMTCVVLVVTWFFLRQQHEMLRKELDAEITPVLESIRNIVLEQTQVEKSLADMEKMRNRIARSGRSRGYYDTYFSANVLKPLEAEIKAQLRGADGKALSEAQASRFINAKQRYTTQRVIEKEQPTWWTLGLGTETVEEVRTYTNVRQIRNTYQERRAFLDTVKAESKEKLSLFNFDVSKFRVQAYEPKGKLLFDTREMEAGNISPVNQIELNKGDNLKKLTGHIQEMANLKKKPVIDSEYLEKAELFAPDDDEKTAQIIRNLYSSDIVSERALRIIKVIDKRSSAEEEIVERFEIFEGREQEILSRLKPVIEQLKKRRVQLKKEKPRNPPGQDKEYSELYSQYRELLEERDRIVTDLFDKINPYRQQKEGLLLKQKDIKASLEQVKKDLAELLKQKKSFGKVKAESEEEKRAKELQLKIEEVQTMIKNIGESLTGIAEEIKVAEYRLENWEYADAEFSPDAFRYLVDAALYENIILRFRYDASEHRKYLRSEKERASVRRAWGQIRTWVMNGRSEIDFVAVDERGRYSRYRPLQNGILAKTRSEAEDIMWQLDQTPLRDLAASSLYKENFAGFIRFLADMGSYHNYFAEQRQKLLITTGSIGFVGLILSWLLATVFVSRIRNVSKRAVAVGIERDLTIRFPATGWDEITQLQNSLNNMLTDLRESEEVRAQMNAAGEVQRRLLPTTIPDKFLSSVDISMFYRAMSNIGGDYYDFIEAADGKLAICIGDVSNHGVGPALIMSNLSAQIHLLVELGHSDPLVILEKLNDLLYRNTPEDMFVTFFMAFYDTASGDMTYCSAGHNDGDLIRANGKHEVIPGGGLPLGMDENDFFLPSLKTEKINLKKGDIFFHCTDGLIEAKNSDRKMFTIERVREILITSHEKDSASMLNDISASLEKFTETAGGLQNLEDDIAMFSVKRSK